MLSHISLFFLPVEIEEFEDLVYQDSDFEFLFDDTIDRKRMEVIGKGMGFSFSFLDVDTWFEEFVNSNVHINPYINNTYEDIDTKHIRYAKED